MSVKFQGTEYLVGYQLTFGKLPREYEDVGRTTFCNQNCPVFRNLDSGALVLQYQPNNAQFPKFLSLRTKEQIMEGWS